MEERLPVGDRLSVEQKKCFSGMEKPHEGHESSSGGGLRKGEIGIALGLRLLRNAWGRKPVDGRLGCGVSCFRMVFP